MEFIVQKIGMSRTVSVPSTAVTLLKVLDTKVCEVNNGVALVSYSNGKKFNKAIEGQQKKFNLSKEFNRFATITVANSEAGDLEVSGLSEAKVVKTTFKTKGRGFSGVVKDGILLVVEHHTVTEWVKELVQSVTANGQEEFSQVKKCQGNTEIQMYL